MSSHPSSYWTPTPFRPFACPSSGPWRSAVSTNRQAQSLPHGIKRPGTMGDEPTCLIDLAQPGGQLVISDVERIVHQGLPDLRGPLHLPERPLQRGQVLLACGGRAGVVQLVRGQVIEGG